MKQGILCVLLLLPFGMALCSCAAPKEHAVEQDTDAILLLFESIDEQEFEEMQGLFNAIDTLSRENSLDAREYLAGYADVLLQNRYGSAYNTFMQAVPQETAESILGEDLCRTFSSVGEARMAFIEQLRSNLLAPSLQDTNSEFYALMPELQDAYQALFSFHLYSIRVNQLEEEEDAYCEALMTYADRLEKAAALLPLVGE